MSDYADQESEISFLLPFTTLAPNRLKEFTKDMEMAAILYLAESSREKGESHILKKPDEKIVFVTKAHYPIWLIPFKGTTLLFDGLGIVSHPLFYNSVPDIQIFDKSIRENRKTPETYTATLAGYSDYFKDFNDREEETIEGLIAFPELLKDFTTYMSQIKETKETFAITAALTSTMNYIEIQAGLERFSNTKERTYKDIEDLQASTRLLNVMTTEKIRAIMQRTKTTQQKTARQIEKIKPIMRKRTAGIQSNCNRKIANASRTFRRRVQYLRENQAKLQTTLRRLRTEARRCETQIQSKRRKKKKRAISHWTLKLRSIKKKLPAVNKEIKRNLKQIQELETIQKRELAQLRTERDERIETVDRPLRDLQAAEEAEITIQRQEIATLENITSQITKQMREMTELKKANLIELDKIALPTRSKSWALAYMPFYIVRYERENQKRYVVYPPSSAANLGALTKMKGTLGGAKMKSLLQPRSEAMTAFLNRLVERIVKDPILEEEVTKAGIQGSILLSKQLRLGVKKGLKELEDENWMSKDELETFGRLLYVYALA